MNKALLCLLAISNYIVCTRSIFIKNNLDNSIIARLQNSNKEITIASNIIQQVLVNDGEPIDFIDPSNEELLTKCIFNENYSWIDVKVSKLSRILEILTCCYCCACCGNNEDYPLRFTTSFK